MAALIRKAFGLVRWLVVLEIGIWRSLFLLITRRVPGMGPGVQAFPYAKEVAPIMGAFIFVSAVELPVVHLLLPWETVRIIVFVLSVWGLLWMVGMLASLKVFPHLLDDDGLRVRYGTSADIFIPWEAIASVASRRRGVPTRRTVHLEPGDEGGVASVAVLKQTRVDVVLRRPTPVALPDGTEEVSELRLYADDHRALVARAREHLSEPLASGRPTGGR